MKQHAPACDRNQIYILETLAGILPGKKKLLEIGSGTGQHAAYLAPHFPDLTWFPTDLEENLASINAWCNDSPAANIETASVLNLATGQWPVESCDAVVCINTIHIISWELVEKLFTGVGNVLSKEGVFYAYGPYEYENEPLVESNQNFNVWLQQRDPASGIRKFEKVNELARKNDLVFQFDKSMPANNRSICWKKV